MAIKGSTKALRTLADGYLQIIGAVLRRNGIDYDNKNYLTVLTVGKDENGVLNFKPMKPDDPRYKESCRLCEIEHDICHALCNKAYKTLYHVISKNQQFLLNEWLEMREAEEDYGHDYFKES